MTIYDAAMKYKDAGVPLVILAGKEYGSGSSRDWAAKGTLLLGVRAVIAESFERIHRSNLVNMGVLPLQYQRRPVRRVAGPDRTRALRRSPASPTGCVPAGTVTVRAVGRRQAIEFQALVRIDTPEELVAFRHGGILPYVLRQLVGQVTSRRRLSAKTRRHEGHGESRRRRHVASVSRSWSACSCTSMEELTSPDIKQQGARARVRSVRHRAGGRSSRAGVLRDWLARGYAGEMAYLDRSAERARRCAPRPSIRAIGDRHRHHLQHRRAVFDRERRSRPRADRAIRLGRRLSRRDRRAARRAARVDARAEPGAVRRARLRRHRSGAGACLRAARGRRLDWQEHLRDQSRSSGRGSFSRRSSAACRSRWTSRPSISAARARCASRRVRRRRSSAPGVLDSTRCISYLTIEQRGPIPGEFTAAVGSHVYGCDVCQEVCPWNQVAPELRRSGLAAAAGVEGRECVRACGVERRGVAGRDAGSAMRRTKVSGMRRNLAVAQRRTG